MKELGTTPENITGTFIPPPPPSDNFPVHYELLTSHETLPPSAEQSPVLETSNSRTPAPPGTGAAKDVGTILAPEAWAALRAHFENQSQVSLLPRGKRPVLKTNTGSFVVAPNPPIVPAVPRSLVNSPPLRPSMDPVLFTSPTLGVQSSPSALLVQSVGGQYQILGNNRNEGLNTGRILNSRMLPIDMKPMQNSSIPQPSPTVFQETNSCANPLSLKLQTGRVQKQELTQTLMDRSAMPIPVDLPSTSQTLAAAAENLKTQFLNGSDSKLVENFTKLNSTSSQTQVLQKSEQRHKRRKTCYPLESSPLLPSLDGLELLLQAAKLSGDELPVDINGLTSGMSSTPLGSVLGSFVGVYPVHNGAFIARCRYQGIYVQIGSFNSAEHAARAYDRVVLGLQRNHAKTNYPPSDYLSFELMNAKRALEAKYKQCQQTRRGSAWPWARAAQTLLPSEEDTSLLSNSCHDYVLNNVPELVQNFAPLTETLSGSSIFQLLQNVMLKERNLDGTFDLIQNKIRYLQQRIQSGLSTEEECNCVGQYAYVASILWSLVSMEKEWERRNPGLDSIERNLDFISFPEDQKQEDLEAAVDVEEEESHKQEQEQQQLVSEGNSRDFHQSLSTPFSSKIVPSSSSIQNSFHEDGDCCDHHSNAECLNSLPSIKGDHQFASGSRTDLDNCPYTESIRWVRLLASSLWPRKRGGGMLWKAYQPLFKSCHHRNSILKLREELFIKPDRLRDSQSDRSRSV
eukprot:g1747.t1